MAMTASKHFQKCRWYDPYPRLAFALRILGLAPLPMKEKAWQLILDETATSLSKIVQEASASRTPAKTLDGLMALWQSEQSSHSHNRQYDIADKGQQALLMLQNSPDSVKRRVTELLLTLLTEENLSNVIVDEHE